MQRTDSQLYSLQDKPDCFASTLELIKQNFPVGSDVKKPTELPQEFPLLLAESQRHRNWILISENQVRSSASFRPFEVHTPKSKQPLMCAGIGLVVTDKTVRGRGFASQIQQAIEEQASQEGCAVSVLWSDLTEFYTNRGYIIAGSELQWHADGPELATLRSRLHSEVSEARHGFEIKPIMNFAETQALYNALRCGPARDAQLYAHFLELPNTWAWGAYRSGQLKAYAFLGKARDLRDTIHELVGDKAAVGALLKAALPHVEGKLRIHQPWGSPLKEEIEHWMGASEKTALAFFKVLDTIKLAHWINNAGILPAGVRIQAEEKRFVVCRRSALNGQEDIFFESDDPGHLIQLFLGPWTPSEMQDLPELLRKVLEGTQLPPLYFWGFDSV